MNEERKCSRDAIGHPSEPMQAGIYSSDRMIYRSYLAIHYRVIFVRFEGLFCVEGGLWLCEQVFST